MDKEKFNINIKVESTGYSGQGIKEKTAEYYGYLISFMFVNKFIEEKDLTNILKKGMKKWIPNKHLNDK